MKNVSNIDWRKDVVVITELWKFGNSGSKWNRTYFRKNITQSSWKRLHKFVVTHNPQVKAHSMHVNFIRK